MAAFMTQPQISSRCVDGDLLTTNQLYDLTLLSVVNIKSRNFAGQT